MGNVGCCEREEEDPKTEPTDWAMATPIARPKGAEYPGSGSLGSEVLDGGRVLPTRNRSKQVDLTIGNLSTEASGTAEDIHSSPAPTKLSVADANTQPSLPSTRSPDNTYNTQPSHPCLSLMRNSLPSNQTTTD